MAAGLPRVYGGDEAVTAMLLFSAKAARRAGGGGADLCRLPRRPRAGRRFISTYGVPDTLQGRFEMLALRSLPGAPPADARARRRSGAGAARLGELRRRHGRGFPRDGGRATRRVPKRMKTLYGSFAGRISAYRARAWRGRGARLSRRSRGTSFPTAPAGRARRGAGATI